MLKRKNILMCCVVGGILIFVALAVEYALIRNDLDSEFDDCSDLIAINHIQKLNAALDLYRLDNFKYPSNEQGLDALINIPKNEDILETWNGPYIKKMPVDPWGNSYRYRLKDGKPVEIFSYGADNEDGGADCDSDISNYDY